MKTTALAPFFVGIFVLFALAGYAQDADSGDDKKKKKIGREVHEIINIDFYTGLSEPKGLPFDVPFKIKGKVPKEITRVELSIINRKFGCTNCEYAECKACKEGDIGSEKKETPVEELKASGRKDSLLSPQTDPKKPEDTGGKNNTSEPTKKECLCGEKTKNCRDRERQCIVVCPWVEDFFSRKRSDTINTVTLEIPPLRANQEYRFYFRFFRRPTKDEAKKINGLVSAILKPKYADLLSANALVANPTYDIDPTITLETQRQIDQAIKDFYSDQLGQQVTTSFRLLNASNVSSLKRLVYNETATLGPEKVTMVLLQMNRLATTRTVFAEGTSRAAWRTILDHKNASNSAHDAMVKVLNSDAHISAKRPLIVEMQKILLVDADNKIDPIVKSQASVDEPNSDLGNIIFTKGSSEIEPYLANSTLLINTLESIIKGLSESFLFDATLLSEAGITRTQAETVVNEYRALLATALVEQNYLKSYQKSWVALENVVAGVAQAFSEEIQFTNTTLLSSTSDFETRTEWYVSADIGVAHVFYEKAFANQLVPYFGVNFNLFPINRQRKYSIFQRSNDCSNRWYQNIGIVAGLSVNALASGELEDSFKSNSLLTGVSLRLADPVRLTGGVIWNRVSENPPLSMEKKLATYWYVSLSFDLDVAKYLGFLGKTLFPNIIDEQ